MPEELPPPEPAEERPHSFSDASGPMTKRLRALYKALEAEEARGR